MTQERWRKIEALYHAVQNDPARSEALLSGVDEEVRREVNALLASPAADPATGTMTKLPGSGAMEQLGPYQVLACIGRGGMGQVFRGLDTRLDRPVAIKTSDDRFTNRFEREARAISSLNHPHICTLYDVGTASSGISYLVMELVEGETLAALLTKGALSLENTLRYGAQIANALAAAHSKGIVHRDLKPSNIMVTGFGAGKGIKVLDFGLAKLDGEISLTAPNAVVGTPAYMAPEQVEGSEADACTDLFALGLVLYEMAAGKPPCPGKSLGRMLIVGASLEVPRLSQQCLAVPQSLDSLVSKLLEKNPADRYQSAAEVAAELSAIETALSAPATSWRRKSVLVSAALAALLVALAVGWLYQRSARQRWTLEVAIPEISKLREETKPLAAYLLLLRAEQNLPGDPRVTQLAGSFTRTTSVKSSTPGTKVEIQDYLSPESPWVLLGTTPFEHVRLPDGYFRWKLSKTGVGEFLAAPVTSGSMHFYFEPPKDVAAGMVYVPGGPWANMIGFIGWVGFQLPAFDMDRFEVTNQEYQKFVDAGGYQKRDYWKDKFLKDGKELTWEQSMDLFRDPTGRPGPSTWEAGHFPQGKANFPVSGVSWYEASAYTAFLGKSLPALGEWYKAVSAKTARYTTKQSNFGGKPMAVGASRAVSDYGSYDLTGNVREWSLNATGEGRRFILGGAWGTQTYQAYLPEALPPFDRSAMNGFRGVRNREPLSPAAAAPVVRQQRDYSKVKPASDEVFKVYQSLYAYDKRPLNVKAEGVVEETADWTKEKITIDAGYERERLPVYVFLPKNVSPPYQTVVFFPSARVNTMPDSRNLGDMDFVDYVIKSGRALAYPIYRVTYERHLPGDALPGAVDDRNLTIQESKEVRRTLDYLETRRDIDRNKFGYLGVSQGTACGVIVTALEDRFKAVVFLDGGFFLSPTVEGRDQSDFAPRLKKPVLMINGKYDFTFPPDESQLPMFRMLGTPPADKFRKVFETPHDVSQMKPALAKEVLAFLDKYLGRIN